MFYGIWRTGQVKVLTPVFSRRGRNFTPVAYLTIDSVSAFTPIFAEANSAISSVSGSQVKIGGAKWYGFLCGDYDPTSIERIAEKPNTIKVYSDYDGIVEVAGEAYTVGAGGVLTKVTTPSVNIGNYLGLGAGYYDGGVLKARSAKANITANDIPVLIAGQAHSEDTDGTTKTFQIVDILYSATGNAVFVCRVNSSVLAV